MLISVHDKGGKKDKNVKSRILNTCENTTFASTTFVPNSIQNIASTSRFKQEFFHVGHQTTAHNLSCGSR